LHAQDLEVCGESPVDLGEDGVVTAVRGFDRDVAGAAVERVVPRAAGHDVVAAGGRSRPVPPSSVSWPRPPWSVSAPPAPISKTSPPSPLADSALLLPENVSLPLVAPGPGPQTPIASPDPPLRGLFGALLQSCVASARYAQPGRSVCVAVSG
jgi:hypothetical protein